ncbi:Murein DD-endopeptidase MepM and murein hydrolase activator NlpD, contain LysM domain [Alkalibacterium thalassium]|uniref:Murein DD-endopeptidase MepM and murein hydrolase activator NlpD, contain LysM domain n=1 Tax=Alkalibacterium thalassium TaxID=426701 RepID=A0A1G8ZMI6_9LACT|nr:Murein DD-endopeptidase MepM and murein hydrolase activator NlpD, contain LysM domain [Alkalibacterium thalassium]
MGVIRLNKKRILTVMAAAMMAAPTFSTLNVEASSQRMRDLEQQQQELNQKSNELDGEISDREQRMQSLEEEKKQLEADVVELQGNIDELVNRLDEQTKEIEKIEEEIQRLNQEIEQLKDQIARRNEQLENQARSVQTHANPADIVDIMMSAESLSDLIGRIGVVSQLVSANQNIVQAQFEDQQALEETEAQVVAEQEEMEKVKAQMEIDRNNLVNQRLALEDTIMQVAERYDMTEDERNSFINEQTIVAERASNLSKEMRAEQQRIIEAERKRQEEIRRAEEKARIEAEAKARAQAEAEAQAQARAEAERRSQASTSSSSSSSNNSSSSSSSSSSSNSSANSRSNNSAPASNSGWARPASGRITSPFGYRTHPVTGQQGSFHAGVDIAGSGPIRASRAGTVTQASFSGSYGFTVIIDHGNGYATLYAHMQPNLSVAPGQSVSQGQQLGIMGTTGRSTGVHLHFEVRKNGSVVNPMNYIN